MITVDTTSTIEAVAEGVYTTTLSAVGSGTYTMVAGTPAFNPAGGSYGSAQTVTISSVTPSAIIFYTTDGTTPTTNSAIYTTPISVPGTEILQAFATYTGFANSTIESSQYTIGNMTGTPTFSPAPGIYNSSQTVTISDLTPSATIYYTTNGTTPSTSSTTYSAPITVAVTETVEAIATAGSSSQSAVGNAPYTIGAVAPSFSPAGGSYGLAQTVTISDSFPNSTIYYTITAGDNRNDTDDRLYGL